MNPAKVAESVRDRYAEGARAVQPELCCPVDYDAQWLRIIPDEVLQRDYGCGDPSKYVRSGETVLDLGSGGGKICFIASQVVGTEGRVIGVDMTDEMLDLARRAQPAIAAAVGYDNVEFRKGRIEDLALDYELLESWTTQNPESGGVESDALAREEKRLRAEQPMVADDSIDVVVSNCVLNLVAPEAKRKLFDEIFRVLKSSGRAIISDIVSDREVSEAMQRDADLWSGCISGALQESAFLKAFEAAGFHGIQTLVRQSNPWQVVEGIEFRSVTVAAYKDKNGPRIDPGQSEGCC